MIQWAQIAFGLWSNSPAATAAELRQQIAGLQLDLVNVTRERDVVAEQLERAVRMADNYRDKCDDAVRVLTRDRQ